MANEKKLKPESNAAYNIYIWWCKLFDLFQNLRQRLRKIPLKEGMKVVDYGCGPGRYTLPMADLVGSKGKVFAVDIQPLAIKTEKEKAARQGLTNVEVILVESYATGIQGPSIDLVLFVDTLHHIEDCNALFHEIHRLLKPDGLLFMDPGRMKISKARGIVEGTGLFTIVKFKGKNMLVEKRKYRNSLTNHRGAKSCLKQ